jgi:hypothetical protein
VNERQFRKEVKKMNYAKPEITLINAAAALIQGSSKHQSPNSDAVPLNFQTISAYEADE